MGWLRDLDTAGRLAGGYLFGRRYPLSVTFIATYRCNFRCAYCGVPQDRSTDELSTGEVFSMIDQLCRRGLRRLGLNGGEPLLRQDIGEIIAYAQKRDIVTTLFTNGWLVKDNIEKLKKLDLLLVSFDGPPQAHDLQRQAGSYDKAMEAVQLARQAGINVWTNSVISRHNAGHIDFILAKAAEYGFKATFQPVYFYAHASTKDKIDLLSAPKEEYIAAIEKIIRSKKQGGPVMHSLRYLEHIKDPHWQSNKRRCWAGRFYFAITPDGAVAPCYPVFTCRQWPNGRNMGYGKAISSIGAFSCGGCFCMLAENDFFFSLKPDVVFNMLRNL